MLIIVTSAFLYVCECEGHGHIHYGEGESTQEFWSKTAAERELEKVKGELSEEEYLAVRGQIEMCDLDLVSPFDSDGELYVSQPMAGYVREYQRMAPYN